MEMKTFQEFIAEAYIKKSEVSGHVNVSRGAVPAKATDASIKGAVDKALANPGQAQSASSERGRMRTAVSGGINVTGTLSTGSKPKPLKPKPEPEPESETRKPREVTKPTARRPREVTQGGSGTPQKGTKIYIKDKTGIRQTSLRDMTARERAGVMPHLTGGSSGMPTAVIRNVSSNRRPTVDKIYQSSTGSTPLNQPTRRQSSTGRAPRQVSQQSSTGRAPRQVSQPSQPSSLGRRSLRGF
tara:strand:+ start:107 stop:832 length:726 start_codon:yes stop_codon:yes gene_type:complete